MIGGSIRFDRSVGLIFMQRDACPVEFTIYRIKGIITVIVCAINLQHSSPKHSFIIAANYARRSILHRMDRLLHRSVDASKWALSEFVVLYYYYY